MLARLIVGNDITIIHVLSRVKYEYRIISGWQNEAPGSIIAPVRLTSWPGWRRRLPRRCTMIGLSHRVLEWRKPMQ